MSVMKKPTAEPTIEDLEAGLAIDEHALQQANQRQPDLYWRVSKKLALLISQRDAAKQRLEEVEAEAALDIREAAEKEAEANADEKGKVKAPREGDIAARVKLDKEVKNCSQTLLSLKRDVLLWTALRDSFEQRSYALKEMTTLYVANYYNTQDTPDERLLKNRTAREVRDAVREDYERREAKRQRRGES